MCAVFLAAVPLVVAPLVSASASSLPPCPTALRLHGCHPSRIATARQIAADKLLDQGVVALADCFCSIARATVVMSSEQLFINQFIVAVRGGDDASAVSLLENGRVSYNSHSVSEINGVRYPAPLIFIAVSLVREQVVRTLARLGASIDSLRDYAGEESRTPAGDAIARNNIPALSLCFRLGANLSCVRRTKIERASPVLQDYSAVETAIRKGKPDSLVFLFDKVYTARPVNISPVAMGCLPHMANTNSHAKVIFKILESRGFNFECLGELTYDTSSKLPASNGELTVADLLLTSVQKSGDADLLRYLAKDLGLVSTAGKMENAKNVELRDKSELTADGVSPRQADLTKYKCAACEAVGATTFCPVCKVPRHCSTECQRRHWKTGGHKKICKEFQRRAKEEAKEPRQAVLTTYKCAACEAVGATYVCSLCKVPRYCSAECQRRHWKTGGHKKVCKEFQRSAKEGAKEGFSGAAGSSVL